MRNILLLLLLFVASCTTVKKLPVQKEVIKTDSLKNDTSVICQDIVENKMVYTAPMVSSGHGKQTAPKVVQAADDELDKEPINITVVDVDNDRVYNKTTQMGNVVYKIPNVMHVRNSYQVLVRISKSEANIYENINGEVSHSKIPITETMQVNLIDDSPTDSKNFDIVKDNDSIQMVDTNGTYTQWTWNVTPLKVGTGKLKVVISIIRDGKKKDVVYEDSVSVKMDLPKQIKFWFNKYWQWLITSIIIPFVVWLYKKLTKEKE